MIRRDHRNEPATWPEPALRPPLAHGDAHVWRVFLAPAPTRTGRSGAGPPATEWVTATLSHEERLRAASFRDPADGDRYALAHTALRDILSRYGTESATRLCFCRGRHGKPRLGNGPVTSGLSFSLSHGGDCAVVAVARGMEIGVDVERIRLGPDLAGLAARCFSPREAARLGRSADPATLFFRYWTSKESYVKGLGLGLAHPLNAFEATGGGDGPTEIKDRSGRPLGWWQQAFRPCPGHVGSLATEGAPVRISRWTWRPGPEPGPDPRGTRLRFPAGEALPAGVFGRGPVY